MASEKELLHRRDVAAQTKRQTDAALAELAKINKVPDAARGEKKDFREALQAALERQKDRVAKITKQLKRKRAGGGAQKAVSWAVSQAGVTEKPYGSNWGVPVQNWIQFTGYSSPVPWCGCFACFAAVAQGGAAIVSKIRLGYAGYIVDDARAGRNGLRAVPFDQALPGDILVFWGNQHIGMCASKPSGDSIGTIEGNTSSGTAGSQNNGGGVYRRIRSRSDVTVVARPAY
jgi:hypothetical protein